MGYQQTGDLCPAQQNSDMTAGHLNKNRVFSSNLSQPAGDPDKGQAPVFTSAEPLSTIQKQDIVAGSSFSVPADSLLQQGSQQFLLETRDGLRQERPGVSSGAVGRLCGEPASQPQQLPLFPPDEVAQLEEAVRQLKAKGYCNLSLQSDNPITKQQQQHIQHQQQIQKQQIQQQQQQQQVMENLQQQLFQSQMQMHCAMFQDASQAKNGELQVSSPGVVTNQGSLFQPDQQQQQQQQQQQAALFQQANDLLSIQTNFLQQTPSHSSPPMFHNPSTLAETQDPQGALFQKASQEQVQAALFQSTMTVLQSPEQQASSPGLFLPQTSMSNQLSNNSSQQQQQQQQQQQVQPQQVPPQQQVPQQQQPQVTAVPPPGQAQNQGLSMQPLPPQQPMVGVQVILVAFSTPGIRRIYSLRLDRWQVLGSFRGNVICI